MLELYCNLLIKFCDVNKFEKLEMDEKLKKCLSYFYPKRIGYLAIDFFKT